MPSRKGHTRRYSSVLGCIDVAGLELALPLSDRPPDFRIDVTRCDAHICPEEVARRGEHEFTLSAAGVATCDVDLIDRSITVRARHGQDDGWIAHFVADIVLPRVASVGGPCLHAAAVAVDGRACALIGTSRAGKSTLAARLCLEGALLLGDDCAHVRNGLVYPAHRPSRLWPDAARLVGAAAPMPDGTGKISLAESEGIVRALSAAPLQEVLVVDSERRDVGASEALDLLLNETIRLVIPPPLEALDTAVELLRAYGPRRTIPRNATLDYLRALLRHPRPRAGA